MPHQPAGRQHLIDVTAVGAPVRPAAARGDPRAWRTTPARTARPTRADGGPAPTRRSSALGQLDLGSRPRRRCGVPARRPSGQVERPRAARWRPTRRRIVTGTQVAVAPAASASAGSSSSTPWAALTARSTAEAARRSLVIGPHLPRLRSPAPAAQVGPVELLACRYGSPPRHQPALQCRQRRPRQLDADELARRRCRPTSPSPPRSTAASSWRRRRRRTSTPDNGARWAGRRGRPPSASCGSRRRVSSRMRTPT